MRKRLWPGDTRNWARPLFWLCLTIITVLSLVPGELRPHTGMHGRMDHAIAYAGTGIFMAIGYVSMRQRLAGIIGVAALSVLFEFLQLYVPGRSSNILDALASSAGLTAGVAMGCLWTWFQGRDLNERTSC